MKHDKLVSIIVPFYNSEKHLSRCIESILNQSYKNIEIILINDGSTDGSLQICEYYLQLDERIKLFNQVNGGPSVARNKGISQAKGDFIQFVDSDDYILPTMTETLVQAAIREDRAYIMCGYYKEINKCFTKIIPRKCGTFSKCSFFEIIGQLYNDIILPSPCNKLFSLDVINHHKILFDEGVSFGEDLLFNLKYIDLYPHVYILKEPLYVYFYNHESLSNTYYPNFFNEQLSLIKKVENFLIRHKTYTEKNIFELNIIHQYNLTNSLSNFFKPDCPLTKKEKISKINRILQHPDIIELQNNLNNSFQAKILALLIKLNHTGLIYLMYKVKEQIKSKWIFKGRCK